MLEDALRYPIEGDDALTTIAIGGILELFGFLIVPVLFVYGYLVRVIRTVSAGDDEMPPAFEAWEELLVDGLKASLVALVYTAVPSLVLTIALAPIFLIGSVSVNGGGGGSAIVSGIILLFVFVVGIVALLLLLAAVYIVPAAVAAFAQTDRLGAAVSIGELRRIGGSGQFAIAWLVAVVIVLVAGFVQGILAATLVGLIALPFLNFYGNVAAAYAIGRGANERPGTDSETEG